jgi:NAD(P)H-dependent FMN reductase
LEVIDLAGIPPFSEDDEKIMPPKVLELKERIRAADAVLFATPNTTTPFPVC